MKNKLINVIVILLLISGIFLLSLPTIRDYQSEKKTQQMITEYEQLIPEDPKPEQPTDPTIPQVGESYFKVEYMFGFMLIMATFILRRYNRR